MLFYKEIRTRIMNKVIVNGERHVFLGGGGKTPNRNFRSQNIRFFFRLALIESFQFLYIFLKLNSKRFSTSFFLS